MTAVKYDLLVEQGAVFTTSWEWREDDESDPPTGPLIDLTDYRPLLEIRTRPGGTLMAKFSEDDTLTVVSGVITLRIGADITETFTRSGVYDLKLRHRTDVTDVERLSKGKVVVDLQVTQG